jgi:hypothetical protein
MPGLRRFDSAMLHRSNLHDPSQLHRRLWWGSDLQLGATADQLHRKDCSSRNAHVEAIKLALIGQLQANVPPTMVPIPEALAHGEPEHTYFVALKVLPQMRRVVSGTS